MSEHKKNWFKRHKVITGIIIVVGLISIGSAIGSSGNTSVSTTPANGASSQHNDSSSKTSQPTAHVGSTVNVGGNKGLAIKLTQVIDPASGADQYTSADAGKRFVAVALKITNNGTSAYNDDANNDVTIIGSDNQTYTDDFNNVAECTDFNDGSFTLAAGESVSGCVNFQLPNGVKTSKVQFTSNSGFSGSTGEWLVP